MTDPSNKGALRVTLAVEAMRDAAEKIARGWAEHYAGSDTGAGASMEKVCDYIADEISRLVTEPHPSPSDHDEARGWVAVPREPTEAMLTAAFQHITQRLCELGDKAEMIALWSAMISAARTAPAEADDALSRGEGK